MVSASCRLRDLVDQRVAVQHVDAVIDAVDADLLQALPDMLGRVLLIDVAMHGQEDSPRGGRARTPSLNFTGGLFFSSESRPTPTIHSR